MTSTSQFIDEFLQWLTIEKGRSRATTVAYRRDLEQLRLWMDERALTIRGVTDSLLEQYFDELRHSERAASSVARAVSSARGFLGFLVEERHLESDPSSRLRGGRRGRTLPKPLSENEICDDEKGLGALEAVSRVIPRASDGPALRASHLLTSTRSRICAPLRRIPSSSQARTSGSCART